MNNQLFSNEVPKQRNFFFFASNGDKAGALKHLQTLGVKEIEMEVLKSGFSMICPSNGKQALLVYAIEQIGKKTPIDYSHLSYQ